MIARLTSDNRLTLPTSVLTEFPGIEYFDVTTDRGRIVLMPVRPSRADAVRARLADLALSDADVGEAVTWARRN